MIVMRSFAVALALLILGPQSSDAIIPGVRPKSYVRDEDVELKVNKMTSVHTFLPIEYYRLGFCQPDNIEKANENLGEFLSGDRIENSPYRILMLKDMFCEQLCVNNVGRGAHRGMQGGKMSRAIKKGYHTNWIVDNLPAAYKEEDADKVSTKIWQGFPVGFFDKETKKVYVNNHINIELHYHQPDASKHEYRIVKFMVEPFSIQHNFEKADDDESDNTVLPKAYELKESIPSCANNKVHTTFDMTKNFPYQEAANNVLFTYDVMWINSNITWSDRWDEYLTMNHKIPPRVHLMSIGNSMVIVFVLTGMIAAILVRNLRRDFNRYNKVATDEEARAEELEEYGWKLVHADVFRPPPYPMLLAAATGTGAQLLFMTFIVVFFSALGFMSPARRGHLLMVEIIMFFLLGGVNGYITARLYKTFKGKAWQTATLATATGFPGITFFLFLVLDVMALANDSSDAAPVTTIMTLMFLWFGIATPLVFAGAYFGYKQDAIEFPVNTSSIPRQIPDQPWFMGLPFTLGIGGILPFGSCFVELYYILSSVWMEYFYYVFGFLLVVFVILIITCAEITILFNYFQLCSEDYHWWWRSFCNAGSTAIYVFLYSIIYFKQLESNTPTTYVLYFGYMGLVSLALFTMTGCVGMLSSLWFNKTIFASIKID